MQASALAGVTVNREKLLQARLIEPEELPPLNYSYDLYYDIRVVVALINAGITDNSLLTSARMFLLGIPVINPITTSFLDFPVTALVPLHQYITLKHPTAAPSRINYLYRTALWYISCHCSYEVQQGVLSWIYDYLISHTQEI